ncbi:MAG: hypothetical protein ACK5P4_00415 [Bacteroidota bacterium]
MKEYLKNIVNQLKNYSITLDKTTILIDKPWALIDEEFELQKLIFKKDKELILSKNGQVQIGKWDYFPEAKSLLIDRNTDKILCNEAFIDKGVMVLKLDGTENRFFILANENIIPDLDAKKYLRQLRNQKLCITETILADGTTIEIQREEDQYERAKVGNVVSIDTETIDDGKYKLNELEKYIEIQKGKIHKILIDTRYTNPDNHEIIIQQQDIWEIKNGDYVFMLGKPVETGCINFSNSKNLIVRNGKVVRLERKNPLTRSLSKLWKKIFNSYNE